MATVGQQEGEIVLWELDLEHLAGVVASPKTVHYTNAKVVLVGDNGVGKSGFGLVLSQQPFTSTQVTFAYQPTSV